MASAQVIHLAINTETVKESPPSPVSELEILTVLQRMESQNEYLTRLVEAQTEKLKEIEQATTSTTLVNTSLLLPVGRSIKYFFPVSESYAVTNWSAAFMSQEAPAPVPASDAVDSRTDVRVPLHLLLELGSLAVGVTAAGSIGSWLLGGVPFVSPFVSLLVLFACPFFFGMGRIARANKR